MDGLATNATQILLANINHLYNCDIHRVIPIVVGLGADAVKCQHAPNDARLRGKV